MAEEKKIERLEAHNRDLEIRIVQMEASAGKIPLGEFMKFVSLMLGITSLAMTALGFYVGAKYDPLKELVDKNASSAKSAVARVETSTSTKIAAVSSQTKTEIRKISDFININAQTTHQLINLTRQEAELIPLDTPIYYPPQVGRDLDVGGPD